MIKAAQRHAKPGKNLLVRDREAANLSKTVAADLLLTYRKRLVFHENNTEPPEIIRLVLAMEQAYNAPGLPERYCSEMCLIGQRCKRRIEDRDLTGAVLGVLKEYNDVREIRDRLISIAEDGMIDEKERAEFERIMKELLELEQRIESLRLWAAEHLNQRGKDVAA